MNLVTYANKAPKERGAMQTLYFTPNQTKEILADAGDLGLILMQHYVAIAHQHNPNMEDGALATMLDKSPKAIEAARLKLTRAGWFRRTRSTRKGEVVITYDVGKAAVEGTQKYQVNLAQKSSGEE